MKESPYWLSIETHGKRPVRGRGRAPFRGGLQVRRSFILAFLCSFSFLFPGTALAAEKVFSAAGDGTSWSNASNWSPTGVPALTDAVTITLKGASVTASSDFVVQSLTVGGKGAATWTVNSFVFGTLTPTSTSDTAILNRKDGTLVLKGAGTITLKGSFLNSEQSLASEPSLLIILE